MIRNPSFIRESDSGISTEVPRRSTRQSLSERFERELGNSNKLQERENSNQLSQSLASWCDTFSSLPTVNPRRALRSGAEKISNTLNTVRTTFGTLSQKLRKSTRRMKPLKNIDSPKTPATPYSRSKTILGRTPTKLYSPFSIETPGKENISKRRSSVYKTSPLKVSRTNLKKKMREPKGGFSKGTASACYSPELKFSNDLVQTQIGIYEFQSTANKIIQQTARE